MIFTQQKLVFRIIETYHLQQKNVRFDERGRHYASLSFRFRSDAFIHSKNESIRMSDNTVSFFPPDVDYRREAGQDHLIAIDLDVDNYDGERVEHFVTSRPEEIGRLFYEIHKMWSSGRMDCFYRASALLYALFAELYGECAEQDDGMPAILRRAIEYLEGHLDDPELSVTEAARHVGVSEVYLRRLFREHRQTSPKRYLTDARIRKAKSLLSSGFYSVGQTALKCGFRDEKYFSTCFRRQVGLSPSRYVYSR